MKTFISAFLFMSASLLADTQITSQYNLPDLSHNWTVGNKIDNEKTTALIFIPKGTNNQSATEFFGLNINKSPSNIHDTSGFKTGLIKMFPKFKIDLWVLEKNKDSILYEWNGKENNLEKIHGWGRAFISNTGNVVVGYFTENISDLPRARESWLPILKGAKSK